MSVKQLFQVWEHQAENAQQQNILLAMADMSNDGGTLWPSLDHLAWKTQMGRAAVRRHLRRLIDMGVIAVIREATPRRSPLYLLHIDRLKPKMPWRDAKMEPLTDQDGTPGVPERHARDAKMAPDPVTDPYHLNGYSDAAGRILEFLNEKTGKKFELKNRANQVTAAGKMVADRLKAKYTEDECRQVIMRQFRLWNPDPKMRDYLRPSTLFKKSNFENYIAKVRTGQ